MSIFSTIFNDVLYRPLLNALFWLYHYIPGHDMGIAVILLTLVIRFIFYPLGIQAIKSQKQTAEIQPKVKEIQEKYKNDKEAQTKALMEFYKENKINPFSGCLSLLVQLPFIIALYQVFLKGINSTAFAKLYSFVPAPESINMMFLGIIDLSHKSVVLAIIAAVSQFIQLKTMPQAPVSQKGKGDFAQMMSKQMAFTMPIITLLFCLSLPSAIALYWITTTVFSIAQQLIVFNKDKK
jgi:YidC/Oxa1 family membrane protein insertase